jgi:hypothetical protein
MRCLHVAGTSALPPGQAELPAPGIHVPKDVGNLQQRTLTQYKRES